MTETLAGAVGRVLLGIGVPKADVEAESAAMADAAFAPTRNRSLLGTVNDFTFAVQDRLRDEPDTALEELAIWMSDHEPNWTNCSRTAARSTRPCSTPPETRVASTRRWAIAWRQLADGQVVWVQPEGIRVDDGGP